jgi:hypothetical protein
VRACLPSPCRRPAGPAWQTRLLHGLGHRGDGIAGFVEVRPISLLLAKSVSTEKKIPPVIGSGRYWSFTSCRNHLTASHAAMAARNPQARLAVPADYKANVAMGLVRSIPSRPPLSSSSLAPSQFSRTPAAVRPSLAIRRRRGPTSIRRRPSLGGWPTTRA